MKRIHWSKLAGLALLVWSSISATQVPELPPYGGTLRLGLNKPLHHLNPIYTYSPEELKVLTQVYEGLMAYDDQNRLVPGLVHAWDVSADGTKVTFHLRKEVWFHKSGLFGADSTRRMTANDVDYCFHRLCRSGRDNLSDWILTDYVKGAQEYFNATEDGDTTVGRIEGISVLDEFTIQLQIIQPYPELMHRLTMPAAAIYPREIIDHLGNGGLEEAAIGTGPFRLVSHSEQEVVLEKHRQYYSTDSDLNPLPYLDGLVFKSPKKKSDQLTMLEKGELDAVLPSYDLMPEVFKRKLLQSNDYTSVQQPKWNTAFYGFKLTGKPFDNRDIRMAFNLAIDRKSLIDKLFGSSAIPASHGLVPPGIPEYPYEEVNGYSFDPEGAKALLAKAGYPNGDGLPLITLTINNERNNINQKAAKAITTMLKENLNVEIVIEVLPFEHHLALTERNQSDFFRGGWNAEYPVPENFLYLLSGKEIPAEPEAPSTINTVRYLNPAYDSIFNLALQESAENRRYALFAEAEKLALQDAPILLLWHQVNTLIMNKNSGGLRLSGAERYVLSRAYLNK